MLVWAILLILFVVGLPLLCLWRESDHKQLVFACKEVEERLVEVRDGSDPAVSQPESAVWLAGAVSDDTRVVDGPFGVVLPGLQLQRRTEYCQWQEVEKTTCQTCTRTTRDSDGHERTVEYDCNCVTEYLYVKGWVGHPIPSVLFKQPAAHWNPQRDPYPSATLVSENAHVEGYPPLHPELLLNVRSPARDVEWTSGGLREPSFFDPLWLPVKSWLGWSDTTFRLPLSALPQSPTQAWASDHFVYVGRGGYFFSPYQPDLQEQLLKWGFQALEGSLFDWQLGDFVGCTPGDIRVSYQVRNPQVVSVIARGGPVLSPIPTLTGKPIGLVYGGVVASDKMFEGEIADSKWTLWLVRFALLIPALFAAHCHSRFMGTAFVPNFYLPSTAGFWGLLIASIATLVWGATSFSLMTLFSSLLLLGFASSRPILFKGGLQEVWLWFTTSGSLQRLPLKADKSSSDSSPH